MNKAHTKSDKINKICSCHSLHESRLKHFFKSLIKCKTSCKWHITRFQLHCDIKYCAGLIVVTTTARVKNAFQTSFIARLFELSFCSYLDMSNCRQCEISKERKKKLVEFSQMFQDGKKKSRMNPLMDRNSGCCVSHPAASVPVL